MKYMGSKNRISDELLSVILRHRKPNQWYVEPFVGGANLIDKVKGNRIGSDYNIYVIEALKLIRDRLNEVPKYEYETSEEEYNLMKNSDDAGMKGYFGFQLSYGGKWFGGWCRGNTNDGESRDYINEGYRNALKQSPKLRGIEFIHSSYDELDIPDNSIIYCDPPYFDTTDYKIDFDHVAFWEWCREMTHKGHKVYVSEYTSPTDFISIWEGELLSNLRTGEAKVSVERLFVHESILDFAQKELAHYFF